MTRFFSSLTWNHYLAVFISIICIGLFININADTNDYLLTGFSLIVIGLVVFGIMGQFHTYLGASIKVSSMLSIGVFIFYMSPNIPDENMKGIVKVVAAIITLIAIVAYIVFFFLKKKREGLLKNGWLLDSTLDEIVRESSDNFQQYWFRSSCKHPKSGELLKFKSKAVSQSVSESVNVGDTLKVYVDKTNPKRYYVDLSALTDDSLFL